MSRYDDLLEQRLLQWASKRHPGKTRDWLLARYWQRVERTKGFLRPPTGTALRSIPSKRASLRGLDWHVFEPTKMAWQQRHQEGKQ